VRTCVWCVVCGVGCALGRALCGCASLTMGNARPPTSLYLLFFWLSLAVDVAATGGGLRTQRFMCETTPARLKSLEHDTGRILLGPDGTSPCSGHSLKSD